MKQFFTLAAAALVALSASAAPKIRNVAPQEFSEMGIHKMQTTTAQMMAAQKAGIEIPGAIKRSYQVGNLEYQFVMVLADPLYSYFRWDLEPGETIGMEDVPFYGAECILSATNLATGKDVTQMACLLAYPCEFWNYAVDHPEVLTDPNIEIDESYFYTPIPLEELIDSQSFNARWYSMGNYFRMDYQDNNGTYAGIYQLGLYGFGGIYYNGNQCQLTSEWTPQNTNGKGTCIDISTYSVDDSYINASCSYVFGYGTWGDSGFNPNGQTGEFSINYDGTAFINGITPHDIDLEMGHMMLFNAGELDWESAGDNWDFWGFPENPLQMYYVMTVREDMELGVGGSSEAENEAIQKDPSFNPDYIHFFRTEDSDITTWYGLRGYLFNEKEASYENQNYTLNMPHTEEFEEMGQTIVVPDFLTPEPNTFVSPRVRDNKGFAPWSVKFGMTTVYQGGYVLYPTEAEGAVVSTNTPNGFLYCFKDQYGNNIRCSFDGLIEYHNNVENMLEAEEVESAGDNPGLGIKNIFGNFGASKVSAKNGVISVMSGEAANVRIVNLNGQVVKNANVAAGQTLNVKAAKGLYIVKVGKEVSKVVL